MKTAHLVLLLLIVIALAVLSGFLGSLTTYENVASAKQKPGQFVHLIARLDHRQPIEYDPMVNPNLLGFTVVDSSGAKMKVVYRNAKPESFEESERLVLKGFYNGSLFECKDMLMKCPSKYKDVDKAGKKLP